MRDQQDSSEFWFSCCEMFTWSSVRNTFLLKAKKQYSVIFGGDTAYADRE